MLDILVQNRRNKQAAKRFFRKLLKGLQHAPRVIITDTLKSYNAAQREILPGVEHRQHKGLNNRAEIRINPRDYVKRRCGASNRPVQAQRFLSADRAHLSTFSTAKTPHECSRLPRHFTEPFPDVQ